MIHFCTPQISESIIVIFFHSVSCKNACLTTNNYDNYEVHLNITIDTMLVSGAVILIDSYTKKTDSKSRKILTVGGLALVVFLFSVILSIFKSKAHGYPYR